jgi:CelD/BcsL family acetyltransferase involved in cellulose biosynthesis
MAATAPLPASLTVHRSFAAAQADWCALEPHVPTAFQRFDWLEGWHRRVGAEAGVELALVVVHDQGGQPAVLWPLGLRRRLGLRRLVWLGGPLSDYGAPIVHPERAAPILSCGAQRLWAAVLEAAGPVDAVELDRCLPELGGRPSPLGALGWAPAPAASHQAQVGDDWEAYYRSRCSSKTRSGHRRKLRRMERSGALRFERATTAEAVARLLPTAFAFKSQHYRQLGVHDHFADAGVRAWLEELCMGSVERGGPAHLSGLWVGDELWATHLGLVHGGVLSVLFPGYLREERVGNTSPGAALVRQLLQWAAEDPALHTVDFTMGDEAYKDRWCDQTTPVYDLIRAASLRGQVHASGARLWRESKRAIKAHPTLFPLALRLRARWLGGR